MPSIPIKEQQNSHTGIGRAKGSKNQLTQEMKLVLTQIVEGQLHRVPEALEKVFKTKPEKYVALVTRLAEICIPKTQEVQLSTEDKIDVKATLEDMRKKLTEDK